MPSSDERMPTRLTKVDDLIRPNHRYISPTDECYYWGEYQVRAGFAAGPTNQLISNIKKSPEHRGTNQYYYKERDIQTAGAALRGVMRTATNITVVPVPPSKASAHPLYDDRMLRIARYMVHGTPADVRELVRQTESYEASHIGPGVNRKTPQELIDIYSIDDPAMSPRDFVIVLDDVLTQGAHFSGDEDDDTSSLPASASGRNLLGTCGRQRPSLESLIVREIHVPRS